LIYSTGFSILPGKKRLLSQRKKAGQFRWHCLKLSEIEYHCHLTYHYVACWRHEKETIILEVYYVGSREDAPFGAPASRISDYETGQRSISKEVAKKFAELFKVNAGLFI